MQPGLQARIAAASILSDIIAGGHPLDEFFVGDAPPKLTGLEPRDRSLVRSIVTVSLRRLGTIRRALALHLERGMPKKSGTLESVLIITAAQILFLDIPDHAAVNSCVLAVRQDIHAQAFAALANAVARNLARTRDEGAQAADAMADAPPWLAARWRQVYGPEIAASIAAANAAEPRLDISVKSAPEVWAERLGGDLLPTGSVRLRDHTPVPDLPGFGDGEWWVQDVAAAIPASLLHVVSGERVADLCAAPGGKTAQLIVAGGHVTAVDRSAERLKRLAANLDRLQLAAETKVADVTSYEAPPFDAILLDAPCTATGTMRRHPDVGWTKRPSDITSLSALQSRMLDRAVTLLKPSGRLVYCVCSIEPEEGEAQIAALLRRNPDVRRDPIDPTEIGGRADWLNSMGELRTLPHYSLGASDRFAGMDGFFAARLIARR